ncbi:MAG: protease modulator HflC [Sedimentisphaerales bacterium]|nr:protease modulator HflC [Sedimentisphaerales bacterium]
MKRHFGAILVTLIIVAILALYFVAFTVRWQEKALVLTFGSITDQVDEPGLNWIWPWQKVVKFDTRIRTYQPQAVQIQTADKQTVIVAVYVNWRISNAQVFYERFRSGTAASEADAVYRAEEAINAWVREAMNVVAEYDLGQLVTIDSNAFVLPMVESNDSESGGMLQRVQAEAEAGGGYGITIMDVGIRQFGVPDSVSTAVFARMTAERQRQARTLFAQGRSVANSIAGRAEAEATRIRARAEAEARSIEGQGDAEAAVYYRTFMQNPDLANFLRRLETLRTTLNARTTIVLDSDTAPYDLLNTGPADTTWSSLTEDENN